MEKTEIRNLRQARGYIADFLREFEEHRNTSIYWIGKVQGKLVDVLEKYEDVDLDV